MTLKPAKHEKEARIGRISNVFRIAGARSAEQSVGIVRMDMRKKPEKGGFRMFSGLREHEVQSNPLVS